MARKAKPIYSGALNDPIVVQPLGTLSVVSESENKRIRDEQVEKIKLLFQHYEIESNDKNRWQKLAIALAFQHVRGLQLALPPGKAGAARLWDYQEAQLLIDEVSAIAATSKLSVAGAIRLLCKQKGDRWGSNPDSLQTRYYEAKRMLGNAPSPEPEGAFGLSWDQISKLTRSA